MDYKEKLKQLKDSQNWETLLSESLALYKGGTEDRYIIRMIVYALEELGRKEEVIPYWELLAREEHHSEEFGKKLIDYHQQESNHDEWLLWSKRLLSHALRKKDYATVEDIWMQFVEAKNLEIGYAFEVSERLIAQEQVERAYTLLDLYLLSLEGDPHQGLLVAKRMLALEPENMELRKRTEGFYRLINASCNEIEHFIENANIRKSNDIVEAMDRLEQLVKFCSGNYVSHRSWGIGKVRSVDLLFGKVFVDFAAKPNHGIDLRRAFDILEPLARTDFAVRKIEDPSSLRKLKETNPSALIKLMLGNRESLSQDEVRRQLVGLAEDDDWTSLLEKVKKTAKLSGLRLSRKGSKYLFSHYREDEESEISLESIDSIKHLKKKMKALLSLPSEDLTPEQTEEWTRQVNELLGSDGIGRKEKMELLIAKRNATGDENHFEKALTALTEGIDSEEMVLLIESIQKRKHRKELLEYFANREPTAAKTLFFATGDDWLRNHALQILEKGMGKHELFSEVLRNPYKCPLCFLFVTESIMKQASELERIEKPIILLEAILELMIQDEAEQKVRSRAKTVFSKFGFDIYRKTLDTSSKEEVAVLLGMVKKHPLIESSEKVTLEKLAESRYPSLREKPKERFFYATMEAISKKQKELDHLVKVEIPANSEEIGKAARQGDLSENFDYISAKEKQRKLIDRTTMLKRELAQVQPIEDVAFKAGIAGVGTRITAKSTKTEKVREITILGPWDAIPEQNIISHTAPLAQQIIGKKVGETFFDSFHDENLEIVSIAKYR